jgi:cytochrome b561
MYSSVIASPAQMKFNREIVETLRHRGGSAAPHGYATRAFHWLGAALLAFAFIENGERTRVLFNSSAMRRDVILGAVIALLFLARPIWVYLFRGGSRLPFDAPRWEKALTSISQFSIYGSLAAVLLSGFLIAYLAPESHIFRARRRIRTDNPLLAGTIRFHVGVSDFLLFIIYAHIAYAFWHWIFRQDGLWESMTGHSLDAFKDALRSRLLRFLDRRERLSSDLTSPSA